MSNMKIVLALVLCLVAQHCGAATKPGEDAFAQKATWNVPRGAEIRQAVVDWLTSRQASDEVQRKVAEHWADADKITAGNELLDRLAASFAEADPQARQLVDLCARPRDQIVLPTFEWLADEKLPALERNNLRLLYGRWLTQEHLHDEASAQLDKLSAADVVDPASLLFYQGVIAHRLLKRDEGLKTLEQLLEPQHEIPRRYAAVAGLMQADLSLLKDDSLDHISRRMDDIRRRLDLGRAGPKVREVEDGVIASLDKLIEEIEKAQAAAAAAAAGAGGNNIRSSSPAPDSVPIGGKGPGNVTHKDIGHKSGWGDLPPKQRQEALQQIGKDFPAHYRDVIEQYFRKLATEEGESP